MLGKSGNTHIGTTGYVLTMRNTRGVCQSLNTEVKVSISKEKLSLSTLKRAFIEIFF